MRKVITLVITIVITILCLTGCDYLDVENKTVIDYRYTAQHTESQIDNDNKITTSNCPEKFELLWEYTYADGHKERKWEECTRFEYQNTKLELGEVEP